MYILPTDDNKLDRIDTEQIKQSVDLRDIAATFTTLRSESRDELSGPCPKCGGDDRFHCQKDWFSCRQCHPKRGDVIEFFRWKDGVGFKEAAAMATGGILPTTTAPVQPTKPVRKPNEWDEAKNLGTAVALHKALISGTGQIVEKSREYIASRGLTLETAQAFKIGYRVFALPNTWEKDKESHCYPKQASILMPWFSRDGSLVAIKYRFLKSHNYTDKDGKERIENKSSRGNFAGAMFGWQAIKGPERCDVLIITEGEINALSLWQAGNGLIDVLSPGTESMLETLPDELATFARQYQHVIVWADKGNIADNAALAIGAHSMRSPNGLDANDLLQAGKLEKLLSAMLRKIGATVEAPSPSAQPIKDEPADYAYDEPEVVQAGLTWLEAELLHNELKATVPNQRIYGIGADPAQPGAYRIVKRNY